MRKNILNSLFILFLLFLSAIVHGQNWPVEGKVTDMETGEALPFVTITEKGTTNGTVSNENGTYSIKVNDQNATLVYSYVGYLTEEVQVDGKHEIDMEMVPDLQKLDEVVVIGYGTTKKSDLTGAITSVSGDDLKNVPATGIDQALQGKAAGVEVISNSGAPGSPMTVRIRGMGTINSGKEPLYVVDGFIMGDQSFGKEGGNVPDNKAGIGFIDPNEIESVEILKDASAAAIYGSRGANGVVLITTKKGKAGSAKINFDGYKGVQTLYKKYDIMNAEEFRNYSNEARRNMGIPIFEAFEEGKELNETNWINEVFQPADIESYKLSASGGSKNSTYLFSINYFDQEGLVKSSGFNKISVRANGDHQLSEKVRFGENIIITRSFRNRLENETGLLYGTLTADPTAEVYDSTGNWNELSRTLQSSNPVGAMERNEYTYESYHYFGNAYLDFDILPSLLWHNRGGIDINNGDMESFSPEYFINSVDRQDNNIYRKRHERWINWDFETTLTYNKALGNHDITLMGGFTAQKETFVDTRLTMPDFPYQQDFMRYPNLPSTDGMISELGSTPLDYSIASFISRAIYNYNDKWLFTASLRGDGSSKFGETYKWGNFPSFSAGYKISEEKFLENITWLSFMKIRAGWGILGNQTIPPYQDELRIYTGTNYILADNTVIIGSLPNGASNEDIHWESTNQTNVGVDAGFFRNKLNFSIDGFYKRTYDLLFQVPIPIHAGIHNLERVGGPAPLAYANAAEMENRGMEAVLTYKTNLGDFNFNVSGNISFVRNKVLDLAGGKPLPSNDGYSRTEEGNSVAGFYGYVIEGIFQDYDDIANHATQSPEDPYVTDRTLEPSPTRHVAPGDFKFKDVNGDGIVNNDDRKYIGSPLPDFSYGLSLNLQYKNFDLYTNISGVQGNSVVNSMVYYLRGYSATNKSRAVIDHWTPENKDSENPRIGVNRNNNMRFSEYHVFDGSYLRVKNLTVGYTIPNRLTSRINVNNFRVYITAQNLFTLTDYPGMEPEIGSSIGWNPHPLDFGVDSPTYPQPGTFLFGLNLTL